MFLFYCQWMGKECSWVTCRPVKIHLETDSIYICTTCLGNLGKSGGTSLWLVKNPQSCVLDGSSLILPLREVRMVSSEGHHIALVKFTSKNHSSMLSALLKRSRKINHSKSQSTKRVTLNIVKSNVGVKAYMIMTWI